MATKVMLSVDEDLLRDIDAQAAKDGLSRSAFLAAAARQRLEVEHERRVQRTRELLDRLPTGHFGGNSAELVKASRPKW